jgi:hypothetical protein
MNKTNFLKATTRQSLFLFIIFLTSFAGVNEVQASNGNSSPTEFIIPANTPIPLVLNYTVNSKLIKTGKTVEFKVAQDIYIGKNVIPQGTLASAKVLKSSKGGCWGEKGKLILAIDNLQLPNGQTISLKAPNIEKAGFSKKGTAWTWFWCTFIFVPFNLIPPLCINGTSAELQEGFTFVAYTTSESKVSL